MGQLFPHRPCGIYKEGTSSRLSSLAASEPAGSLSPQRVRRDKAGESNRVFPRAQVIDGPAPLVRASRERSSLAGVVVSLRQIVLAGLLCRTHRTAASANAPRKCPVPICLPDVPSRWPFASLAPFPTDKRTRTPVRAGSGRGPDSQTKSPRRESARCQGRSAAERRAARRRFRTPRDREFSRAEHLAEGAMRDTSRSRVCGHADRGNALRPLHEWPCPPAACRSRGD